MAVPHPLGGFRQRLVPLPNHNVSRAVVAYHHAPFSAFAALLL